VDVQQRGFTAARGDKVIERVGLTPRRDHFPTQLSGGEQQRVAIPAPTRCGMAGGCCCKTWRRTLPMCCAGRKRRATYSHGATPAWTHRNDLILLDMHFGDMTRLEVAALLAKDARAA